MRRFIWLPAVMLCVVLMTVPVTAYADAAIGGEYNYQGADFYVVVDAPDNYVNFRYGPGLEYGINFPIYNGDILHVTATAENYYDGLLWGQVEYNGEWGWISISQTSMIDDPYAAPQYPEPEPDPVTEYPAPAEEDPWAQPQEQSTGGKNAAEADAMNIDQSDAYSESIHGIRGTGYLVEDAYYYPYEEEAWMDEEPVTKVLSIPVINLPGSEIQALNKAIYKNLYMQIQESLHSNNVEILLDSSYYWSVNGDILSLVIYTSHGGPWHEYMVYNISVSNQTLLDSGSVIRQAGWTEAEYLAGATEALRTCFWIRNRTNVENSTIPNAQEEAEKLLEEKTLSPENLASTQPYINGENQLCFAGKIDTYMTQVGFYWALFNLEQVPGSIEASLYVRVNDDFGQTVMYQEPGNMQSLVLAVPSGQMLLITEVQDDPGNGISWGRTTYNGQNGWIRMDTVTRTEPFGSNPYVY